MDSRKEWLREDFSFDSFVWCLFGKDHLGRSDYELKTHDNSGNTIPRLDCEVEIVINVDGKNE